MHGETTKFGWFLKSVCWRGP